MVMWPSQSQTGILLLWILSAFMHNSSIWGLKVQTNETDRQKLLCFKQQVKDSFGMLSTWSNKQDCCEWAGVKCDHLSHRVTHLSLPCRSQDGADCLAGEFNLSILLELEFLNYLDLSGNNLLFTPPRCCGNHSSKLLYLDLSFNHPELELDDLRWLIQVNSLEYLNLGGIGLQSSSWLQSINTLPSLLELDLSYCQLHEINPSFELVNFTLLKGLDLSHNYFHSDKLPMWLFNLSHVWFLDLEKNFFRGNLPETLLNLPKLEWLSLSDNKLDGPIPNWLGQLENLQQLHLANNFFVGPIPETLGNISSLIELYLCYNLLNESLPENLRQLSKLEDLDVRANLLTGVISEKHFSHLSNLEYLSLGSPALTFHFDPHWIPSFQLHVIFLAYLHHKLPAWIYTQKSLQGLRIINSSLSLEDQDKFWNFAAEIEFLELRNSSISGDLSKVLLNNRLTQLIGNNLRGGLPRISPKVTLFITVNNSFSGTLSSLLCQKMERKSNLSFLHISDTCLDGGLTECWMNWKSLVHISLPNNGLTGKIPKSMSLLSNLKSLHLNKNKLFGYIPASLQNCQKLSILNLDENKFSGDVPYWISKSVQVLLLRSNQFNNNIPPQLCQLSSLAQLDIANNRLSGTIPTCVHNITAMVSRNTSNMYPNFPIESHGLRLNFGYSFELLIKGNQLAYSNHDTLIMRVIDLSHNSLIGSIPPEMFTLFALQSLNLSNNQLTGKIPQEIGNLRQLESLDLSNNQIGGEIPQSMSELSFLSFLNLSFNHFTGQIPQMAQFQRFDVLCFIGNDELCGAPLSNNCTPKEKANFIEVDEEDEGEFLSCFYIGLGVGYAIGFWAVSASLFFNKTWRHAYFRFIHELTSQLHVFLA